MTTKNFRVRKGLTLDGTTSGEVNIAAPAVAGSQDYTLPTALPGVSGYVLASDTSGVMSWVANPDTDTKYTIDASSTTGGANLNLVGTDSTTDTVKFASGTAITVSQTDASTITINNAGVTSLAAGTYLSVSGSTGAVTVSTNATSANTASTLVARDASGNFSAGTITANLANGDRVLGALGATTSTTYTFSPPVLSTISDNNGVDAVSSYANTLGNGAQQQFTQYFGDTFAGNLTSAAIALRSANGNSELTGTVPFTGLAPSAPSATLINQTFGTLNFTGYATTNFGNYIATQNQGGGRQAAHNMQIQSVASENQADGTLTISGGTITAVSRVSAALASVSVTGTKGQISFTATTPAVGNAIVVTGTNSGTSTGITAGTYYIVQTASTSTAQLSATPGGAPITTTAGTTTGLTFTRQFITVTFTAQSYVPFGNNSLVTISGFTNVTSGTYMCLGTNNTTTAVIGAPSSGVPALSGSQSISCPTVTNAGATFRVRAMPVAIPMNTNNRVDIITHAPESATYRADSFVIAGGSYGNTGTTRATIDATKAAFAVPVAVPNYTAVALRAITGAVGYMASVNDAGGKLAYWDTTNTRWSYVFDNSAV